MIARFKRLFDHPDHPETLLHGVRVLSRDAVADRFVQADVVVAACGGKELESCGFRIDPLHLGEQFPTQSLPAAVGRVFCLASKQIRRVQLPKRVRQAGKHNAAVRFVPKNLRRILQPVFSPHREHPLDKRTRHGLVDALYTRAHLSGNPQIQPLVIEAPRSENGLRLCGQPGVVPPQAGVERHVGVESIRVTEQSVQAAQ